MATVHIETDPQEVFPIGCVIQKDLMVEPGKARWVTAELLKLIGLPVGENICRECGETVLCGVRRAS